jgi:hypothetical protein
MQGILGVEEKKPLDMKQARHIDAIVENTVQRAIPESEDGNVLSRQLDKHRRDEVREIMRDGMKKRIDAGTVGQTVDTLKGVLGADNDGEG